MKGVICYYSATGNTKLALDYIRHKLDVEFELCNIARDPVPDFTKYGIAGFACPVDWLAEPYLMQQFMSDLPTVKEKPAFFFATFGGLCGRTLTSLKKKAAARGFKAIAAHGLRVPDSYPPLLATGRHNNTGMPNRREQTNFDAFISKLNAALADIGAGKTVKEACIGASFLGAIAGRFGRDKSKRAQGPKFVDEALCTKCGICAKGCPYRAIKLDPLPAFDEGKCWGCWACYNKCPTKAIYTNKLRGKGHYPGPTAELKKKLKI